MSCGCSECAVVLLPGLILVVGGWNGRASLDTTEAVSIQTITFAAEPTMLTPRRGCAMLALPQDCSPHRALIVGGHHPSLATTEVLTTVG